ncbi:MAG: hypothetical protein RIT28_4848 [Pseudomonadota bacterium]
MSALTRPLSIDDILTDYLATVRYLVAVYGEARVRLALPVFPRVGKKKG